MGDLRYNDQIIKQKFWLNEEIDQFFAWIISSTIFMAYSYLFKFKSIWKIVKEKY